MAQILWNAPIMDLFHFSTSLYNVIDISAWLVDLLFSICSTARVKISKHLVNISHNFCSLGKQHQMQPCFWSTCITFPGHQTVPKSIITTSPPEKNNQSVRNSNNAQNYCNLLYIVLVGDNWHYQSSPQNHARLCQFSPIPLRWSFMSIGL